MNGLKTILAMLVGAYLVPLFAAKGMTLSPEDQTWVVGAGMAGLGIVMRFFSTGPALADVAAWFTKTFRKQVSLSDLSQADVEALTNLVIKSLKARQVAAKDKPV